MKELREPYLVQRLKKPYKRDGESDTMKSLAEVFAFGGGFIRGGISKEVWDTLRQIWRYDYMGSAEFEFGKVPESLHEIGQLYVDDKLIKFEMSVTGKIHNYRLNKDISTKGTVYVVCDKEHKNQIQGFIESLANGTKRSFHTKESVNLADNICGVEHHKDTVGWHDIDNHYLFFTDKEMYDNFCKIVKL